MSELLERITAELRDIANEIRSKGLEYNPPVVKSLPGIHPIEHRKGVSNAPEQPNNPDIGHSESS